MSAEPTRRTYQQHYRLRLDWYERYLSELRSASALTTDSENPTVGIDFYQALVESSGTRGRYPEDLMPVELSASSVLVRQRNYMLVDPKMPFFYGLAIGTMIAEAVPTAPISYQVTELMLIIPVPHEEVPHADSVIARPLVLMRDELRSDSNCEKVHHCIITVPLSGQAAMECPGSSTVAVNVWARRSAASYAVVIDNPPETYESAIAGGVTGLLLGRLLAMVFPRCELTVEMTDTMAFTVVPDRG